MICPSVNSAEQRRAGRQMISMCQSWALGSGRCGAGCGERGAGCLLHFFEIETSRFRFNSNPYDHQQLAGK